MQLSARWFLCANVQNMGRKPNRYRSERSSTGQFVSGSTREHSPPSSSPHGSESELVLGSGDNVVEHGDNDSDYADNSSSDDEWRKIALPTRKLRKKRKARNGEEDTGHRATERRRVEAVEAGPSKEQTGEQRGRYGIGGLAPRTIREKKQKAKLKAQKDGRALNTPEFLRELESIDALGKPGTSKAKQTSLGSFFRSVADAESDDDIECLDRLPAFAAVNSMHTQGVGTSNIDEGNRAEDGSDVDEEDEDGTDGAEESEIEGDVDEVAEKVAVAGTAATDEAAEWVNDMLEDLEVPRSFKALRKLADEGLKKARKAGHYKDEVLFASLSDFYKFLERQGRGKASLRVANKIGRGGECSARRLVTLRPMGCFSPRTKVVATNRRA